jgi:PAS domain S-box-containing protein
MSIEEGRVSDPGKSRARALVHVHVRDVVFLLGIEGDQFRFLEINPAFTQATGLSDEQVVGRLVEEVIPEPSRSLVLQHYRTALAERRTVRWTEVTDYPAGRKYGEVSITPVVEPDGEVRTLVGTVHDVTLESRTRSLQAAEKRVLEMVASGEPLERALTALVLGVEEQAPTAIASVLLLSDDGRHIRHGAAPHLPEAYNRALDGQEIGPTHGSCGTAAALRKQVIVTDIESDPLWVSYRELARPHGLRACWSTPICTADNRVLGTFALYYREPRAPTQDELEVIDRAVHVAGIALQRHELDSQLRALSTRVEEAREEERTGIAREIHDQLGQGLTVLKMDLAWIGRRARQPEGIATDALLAKLVELASLTDEIIGQVRRISSELRPGVLDDLGLVAAVSWKAQEFEKRTDIPCAAHATAKIDARKVSRELATTVFRVLEEALTNVARHAEAKRVDVLLDEEADEGAHWLVLRVRDDGKGILAEEVNDRRALGILGMRERARRHGGTATFARLEPHGTEVTVRLPLS